MRMRKPHKHEWTMSFASISDIAFLLIIFFIVAGHFTQTEDYELKLPAAEFGERGEPRDIQVAVTPDGFLVNGEKVEEERLVEELSFYIIPDAPREEKNVIVYAHEDDHYGRVATAIDAVNQVDAYLELTTVKE